MTRQKLVQFWIREKNANNERLDSDILILRQRVWERASEQVKQDRRNAEIKIAGILVLIAFVVWILAR